MLKAGSFTFPLGTKTYIMGILNYTPDSFSDGGRFNTPQKALEHALLMEKQGADIIDLGAESTRPGSTPLTAEEELQRLAPALYALEGRLQAALSVDTFHPESASFALDHGAVIINDVSGSMNPEIAELVKAKGAAYTVTHNPSSSACAVTYPDGATAAVRSFFLDCLAKAKEMNMGSESICLDPGFGFGKTVADDHEIVNNMNWLKFGRIALVAGTSRKRMTDPGRCIPPEERDYATAAANALCISGGADIIRVHNVAAAVQCAKLADSVCRKVR